MPHLEGTLRLLASIKKRSPGASNDFWCEHVHVQGRAQQRSLSGPRAYGSGFEHVSGEYLLSGSSMGITGYDFGYHTAK